MNEFRHCPFCGIQSSHTRVREYHGEHDGFYYQTVCGTCGARGPKRQGYDEAVSAWAQRAGNTNDRGTMTLDQMLKEIK